MNEFDSIEDVVQEIKNKLDSNTDKKRILTLYAFNGIGKTRLSNEFNLLNNEEELTNKKVLCYNAFLEDLFKWDNEDYILSFHPDSWEARLIRDQGLESNIIDNFQKFLNTKIEPYFDLDKGEITFNIPSGDDDSKTDIKISRGEESMFIWSIFYTILETVINELNESEDDRSTDMFNDLEYIIIDDPVSSIDDTKIITLAIELIELINSYNRNKLKFLVTSHHALFYNISYNSFKRNNDCKYGGYILSKNDLRLKLEKQGDSPFGYHLLVKDEIQNAVNSGDIKKYHFNLFRGLLEKTSNFLGFNNWVDCITGDKKEEFVRLLNLYSHNRLEDMEYKELSDEDKDLFKVKFDGFIREFKWKLE